ncbi:MAG: hypothetical protein UU35_C0012G0027 [Candidatus Uhrbacteria bacterium GW2011_GWC2_41_11]|uniref:Uncharacterized protein n=1 Tax=Candidatus Uhrbacteria bacterium GW2011_GWC2_41_11 TaxID=1618985 RepID=A0A0G0WPV2_9BACT|nr:MAG: hypothetical protein UU35_C0012G0027 [Candidatus Uhrbacteria bacterium GW2011_GWC2_41_11]
MTIDQLTDFEELYLLRYPVSQLFIVQGKIGNQQPEIVIIQNLGTCLSIFSGDRGFRSGGRTTLRFVLRRLLLHLITQILRTSREDFECLDRELWLDQPTEEIIRSTDRGDHEGFQ